MRTRKHGNLGISRKSRKADAGRASIAQRIVSATMAVVLALGMAPTLAFADPAGAAEDPVQTTAQTAHGDNPAGMGPVQTTAQTAGDDNTAVGAHLDAPENASTADDAAAPKAQLTLTANGAGQEAAQEDAPAAAQTLTTQDAHRDDIAGTVQLVDEAGKAVTVAHTAARYAYTGDDDAYGDVHFAPAPNSG